MSLAAATYLEYCAIHAQYSMSGLRHPWLATDCLKPTGAVLGDVLLADHEDKIAAEPRRWKRALRRTNAIVFGLAKRLAPPRRLVFAVALVLTILAFMFGNGTEGWPFAALLVSVLALAFLLAMELVDKLHFKDELVMARDLQAQLVPRVLPEIGAFELSAFNRIANTVGGDLYAFEPLPDGRLAVLFGDASGHGMAAGLVMAVEVNQFGLTYRKTQGTPLMLIS